MDNTNDYDYDVERMRQAAQTRPSNMDDNMINLAVADDGVAKIQSKSHQRPFYHPQSEQVKNGERLMR